MRAFIFIAGAAAAGAIWWYATPAYNDALCRLLHVFGLFVTPHGREIIAMRAGFTDAHVPADQLTYNVILFAGLVGARTPRVFGAIVATLVLLAFHPVALAIDVEATFTKSDVWMALDFLYRIGGMFAIAFVCWYAATTPVRAPQPGTSRKSARAGRARPRAAATSR